ncbi:MAG: GNAT family N-acetyltransferase [Eubacterium sp.]|nr:GNAT family N-acetyltransferase [Eubacterium sp.]
MRKDNQAEQWDLYTKDREKTGKLHRRGDPVPEGSYRLAVHVCIFNSKNELLVQQRQPFKKGWPNMWDVSVGGSAVAGESSAQAAERETWEELGLKLDFSKERPFLTMNFSEGFDDFYIIEQDCDLKKLRLQQEEVQRVRWAGKEEVIKMQAQGIMIPYWFLDRLFEIRDSYDSQGERIHRIQTGFAGLAHLESWLHFAEVVKCSFPGMDTDAAMQDYCDTVISHIKDSSAIYAADARMIVGVLLFAKEEGKICCLAVHPEYRRKRIASKMLELMRTRLAPGQEITVETFREDDPKGEAARKFYTALGFVPGSLKMHEGYPVQEFYCRFRNRGAAD